MRSKTPGRRMKWGRHWPWLLVLPILLGLARLRMDVEVLDLLPSNVPVVDGLKLFQKQYANARELIITVKAPEAEAAENAARSLAGVLRAASNLTASVNWQPPWNEHPDQAGELVASIWLNQPPAIFKQLNARLAPERLAESLAAMREQLATSISPNDPGAFGYDPFGLLTLPEGVNSGASTFGQGQDFFASPDGTFRFVFVQAKTDLSNYRKCVAWLAGVKGVVEQWQSANPAPGLVIQYTGGPAFEAEISSGMERDMTGSVGITSIIIAVLFWLSHRRIAPMLWLLTLLAIILGATLALGGLIFGAINVVSLGFAGILLGLAVDYGVVHYQEAMSSPNAIIPEIRRAIGPSIFWAAATTISAFLALNLGGLPGLAQLGSLVAIGVALSAIVMLYAFLPPLFRDRERKRREQITAGTFISSTDEASRLEKSGLTRTLAPPTSSNPSDVPHRSPVFCATILFVVGVTFVLFVRGLPKLDNTAAALRPRRSASYAALDEMQSRLTQNRGPLWLITSAADEATIARRLERAEPLLKQAVSNGFIASFNLPTPIWPQPDHQAANREAAAQLVGWRGQLHSAVVAAGFTTNSYMLADRILDTWQVALASTKVFWPTNETSRWVLEKVASRHGGVISAVGLITPPSGPMPTPDSVAQWAGPLQREGFIVSGWDLLGPTVLQRVQQNLPKVMLPMIGLVFISLWLAFRRPTEILLSLLVLAMSGLGLLAVMRCCGWSWNLLNLMALPLMLGSGVDYSIFMQLALRRQHGDLAGAHRSVGRALLLCGATAMAGFGSLAWSTNAGIASLGAVCAVGIGFNMLISVCLLPVWWRVAVGEAGIRASDGQTAASEPSAPSRFYGPAAWRLAVGLAGLAPRLTNGLCRVGSRIYWLFAGHRRETLVQNLLPVFAGHRARAVLTARRLQDQFARKLADLWRYESGKPVDGMFRELNGWENFTAAQCGGRGVLLLTVHLGNWEFGAPLLGRHDVPLLVVTLAEPGSGFTEMRQASRARWGIETLVIGEDPFAFVEVIRRLEGGATVALLLDRPPPASAVRVELFGRPFDASIAAAELARAVGCALVPVCLVRGSDGYVAEILPAVSYDRRRLGNREARQRLTQEIMKVFEPMIQKHADQWYHFVPVWPSSNITDFDRVAE